MGQDKHHKAVINRYLININLHLRWTYFLKLMKHYHKNKFK